MKKNFVVVGALAGTLIFTQSALAAGLRLRRPKTRFRAVRRGRADGGGCPCVSVSG